MDKTVAGMIGAFSALAAAAPGQAAPSAPPSLQKTMEVGSYADLLQPIPNAIVLLKEAAAADEVVVPEGSSAIEDVRYHHHHHRHYRRRHHHHHNHY